MTDPTGGRPAGHGRHGRADAARGGFGETLVRYRWHAVISVGVASAVLVGGAIIVLRGHDVRLVGNGCGMVNCSAALPGASAAPQGSPTPPGRSPPARRRAHTAATRSPSPSPSVTPSPGRSRGHPTPSASPTTSPSPTPTTVDATVTYTLDQRWPGGFQGHFTIVNNGTTALTGWALTATLPGDSIDSVWSASYTVNGYQLTLTAPSGQPSIAPGASQSAYFTASGSTARPTDCVFNNQACTG